MTTGQRPSPGSPRQTAGEQTPRHQVLYFSFPFCFLFFFFLFIYYLLLQLCPGCLLQVGHCMVLGCPAPDRTTPLSIREQLSSAALINHPPFFLQRRARSHHVLGHPQTLGICISRSLQALPTRHHPDVHVLWHAIARWTLGGPTKRREYIRFTATQGSLNTGLPTQPRA